MDKALKKAPRKSGPAQHGSAKGNACFCHDNAGHETPGRELCNICEKIEQAHQEWMAALDEVEDLIFLYGKDFRIIRCNRAYQQYAGMPFKQIIGRLYYEIFPKLEDPLHSSLAAIQQKTRKKDLDEEVQIEDKTFRSRATAVRNEHNIYLYTIHILENISARKKTDADLKLFRTLLDNSSDAIEIIDPATLNLVDVNETECRDLGYSRKELLSMNIRDIDRNFSTDIQKKVEEQTRRHAQIRFESMHWRKDGSAFPVEISAKVIELDKPYILAISRDISERKKTETELLRLNRVLKTLSECNRAMLRAGSELELMQGMCDVIVASGGYSLAWIGLTQQDADKTIEPAAIAGTGKQYVEALNLSWDDRPQGQGPAGIAIRTGITQIVQNTQQDPRIRFWQKAAAQYGYAAVIVLPLKENGRVFGILAIYSSETEAFSDDEISLLEEVSYDLAFGIVALRTRCLHEQISQRLYRSLEGTITAMASMVEMRDPYTAGHQHRVAELAQAIARELKLPEEDIHGIYLASVIHDLGKISIPAEILSKPGKLNKLEYEIIQIHPQAGYDILKQIEFPWPIAQMVHQHHERPDGSGYPNGLKDGEILIGSRIIAVADTVEAMSSHRPYRPGLGIEAALGEIEQHRGTRYGAEVVDACLKLFREQGYQLPD